MNPSNSPIKAPSCDFTQAQGQTPTLSEKVAQRLRADGWDLVRAPTTGSLATPRWIGRRGDETAFVWVFTFKPNLLRVLNGFHPARWQQDLHPTHKYLCMWRGLIDPLDIEDLRDAGIATVTFEVQS